MAASTTNPTPPVIADPIALRGLDRLAETVERILARHMPAAKRKKKLTHQAA